MKLWSFQPQSIIEQWLHTDYWTASLEKSEHIIDEKDHNNKMFSDSYKWLSEYMKNYYHDNDIPVKDFDTPIWAWRMYNNKIKKPDLRLSQFAFYKDNIKSISYDKNKIINIEYYDEPFCLAHLNVPDELVVLSNFEQWHSVLNKSYIFTKDEFRAQCDCEYDVEQYDDHWCEQVDLWYTTILDLGIEDIKNTWDRIFLEENIRDDVQATFPYMNKDWIVQVDKIKTIIKKKDHNG